MRINKVLLFVILLSIIAKVNAQSFTINTILGNGTAGFGGDGCSSTNNISCNLNYPYGVASDDSGNVYIADWQNNKIRKVNTSGIISTFAGMLFKGYSGDGGPATIAKLNCPTGVAIDKKGNVYIADDSNNVIRMVNTSGIISTVAGDSIAGFSGDGGAAIVAELKYPTGVALDTIGNIYVADQANNRIREINSSGIITTLAGTGFAGYSGNAGPATSAELNFPFGCTADGGGNVYIADTKNNRIRKISTGGIITNIAGNGFAFYSGNGGPATAASLNTPYGVLLDKSGNIYIADTHNNCIRKVDASGIITTFACQQTGGWSGDGGPDSLAQMSYPFGLTMDGANNIYVADTYNDRVRKINTANIITNFAGDGMTGFLGDGHPAISGPAMLNGPYKSFVDKKGNIYTSDWTNRRVRKIDTNGILSTFAGSGSTTYRDSLPAISVGISWPNDMAEDSAGNIIITSGNNHIWNVDTHGIITTLMGKAGTGYSGDGGPASAAEMDTPDGILIDKKGNIYIADEGNNVVRKINSSGIITTVVGNGYKAGTSKAVLFVIISCGFGTKNQRGGKLICLHAQLRALHRIRALHALA